MAVSRTTPGMSDARTLGRNRVRRARVCLFNLIFMTISCLATATTAFGDTFRDEFDSISYSGNNGSSNWTNSWQEANESDGVSSGFLRVTGSSCTSSNCIRIGWSDGENQSKWLWREADTSGASTLAFSYDVRTSSTDRGWVDVEIRVGGGSWTRLDSYDMDAQSYNECGGFDVSSFIGTDTQVRFWGTNRDHNPNTLEDFRGYFHFDNIELVTDAPGSCPQLAVTKTDSADPVIANTWFTYTMVVDNTGGSNLTSVELVDTLPAGTTYQSYTTTHGSCSHSSGTVTCPLGTVTPSTNATVTITVLAPSSAGSITNDVTVTATGSSPASTDEDTMINMPTSFVVNSTGDASDNNAGNGICDTGGTNSQSQPECTLRAAMEEANALAGADDIDFNIPTTESGYSASPLSYTISPSSALPAITEQLDIDGSTQPDFPGTPIIEIDGTSAGAGVHGLQLNAGSDGSTIRGLIINNFTSRGINVLSPSSTIVGNWIGLEADGVTAAGNGVHGIVLSALGPNSTVGGTVAADRNVISANTSAGIYVTGDNNLIIGNYVGTTSAGAVAGVGNGGDGILINIGADGNTVGGTTVASRNIIADNGNDGIFHPTAGVANTFLGNAIYGNSGLGIDLGANGLNANDAGDGDTGANNLLNWPVIVSAFELGGLIEVDFDLDVPAGDYRVEFFTSPSGADSSGNGEGEVYQSVVSITHGGTGAETFSHSLVGATGDILTATATVDLGGSTFGATSEFGNAFTAVVHPCPGGVVGTTTDSVTGDSLRGCIIWANANAGADTLTLPAGTFTLTIAGTGEDAGATGDLDITDTITINGDTAAATIIDGNSIDRVFDIRGNSATFTNVTVSGGSSTGDGGGIAFGTAGTLTMTQSTISNNTTTVDGGGIATAGGAIALTNVTVSGNTAANAGGLDCAGACTLTNVTVTGNTAPTAADGVRQTGAGTITFLNTIVANNLSGGVDECVGSVANLISTSNNLSSDGSCDFTSTGDQPSTDPLLGPLQDNGGTTFTHELLTGSPAIDGGTDTGCPGHDQRSFLRAGNGLSCDIGAYELDQTPYAVTSALAEISPNDVTTNAGAYAFSYDINATITGTDTGVNRIAITVPGTFTVPASPVTNVLVDGASVAFTDNTSGNDISIDLTTKVTESSRITILFTANAPTTEDLTGVDFLSTVDDSATPTEAAQNTTEGNADGDTTDLDSWTVTSTDLPIPPGACTIAVDGTVSTGSTTGSSITISHTTSGTDRLMLVGVSILNGAFEEVINPGGITYNGDNLTRVGVIANTQSADPGNDGRVEIWRLVAPDTGTHDVVITFDADLLQAATAGVMTFTGVDQTTPLGSFASDENDGATSSVSVPSAVDDLVYAVMAGERTGTVSAVSPATERWSLLNGDASGAGATRAGAAGNVTVSFSHGNDHWAVGGVSIKPAQTCGGLDHFSIVDNGNSSCSAETVTIAAHRSDHSVETDYQGLVRLTTSTGNGDWTLVTGAGSLDTSGNGNATYTYDAADNGSVVLALLNTNVETVNVDATNGSATEDAGEDPDLDFITDSGPPAVALLDSWVVDGTYATQDDTFNVSAGTDRLVLVGLSAEKNASGPISVTSVSLGDQVLTEVFDFTVGSSSAYHNLLWLGYLKESEIASRSGSGLTISYANAPGNPFDEPKIHYASYENVDQTTPIADSSSNSSTSASSLQLSSSLTAGEGDKIVGFNVLGQHYSPGLSTGGYTEETQSIGASNGHASAAYHRTATTATTENPNFTSSSATRMAVSGVVLNAAAGGVSCGTSGINHFSISHDGTGINCQAEPITIEAHDSGHSVLTGYTGAITLSTSTSHGDWSVITGAGTPATTGSGVASYEFDATDNGSVVLGLRDTFVETVNINVTDGSASEDSGEDPNLVFARAGFNFLADGTMNTIGTQIGGKASNVAPGAQTLELQAVKTSDDTGACEAALTGATTIEIGFECENPAACTANQLAFSGANLPNNSNASVLSYTGISMDFGDDTDSTATFTINYPDVGQVKLHARTRLMPSGEAMLGGSNSFVVRPFAFYVTATDNPGATGPGGAIFTSAGTNFSAQARALLWEAADDLDNDGIADDHDDGNPANNADLSDNTYALNFGNETVGEQVTLTATLDQPSGGVDPGLSGGTTIGTFTSGSGGTNSIRFDEVGIIELSAAIADSNYLGIGALETGNIRGKSGYVGRFTPAQYAVTASSILPACGATFTYARQTFTGSMTIEAQNGSAGGNARTQNYRAGFVTLDPDAELVFQNDQTAAAYDAKTVSFNEDFDSVTTGEAKLDLQFRWDMVEQAPATSTVQNTAVTDEVTTLAASPVVIGTSPTRYGRVSLGSAVGSELVTLGMPMRTEYYFDSSTGYVTNTADSCSTGVSLSFSGFADDLDSGETCVQDTGSPGDSGAGCVAAGPVAQRYDGPPIVGDFNLWLDAPGAGNDGSVSVDATVPDWLQFDWDTAVPGLENPSGRATFGIYGGHSREIYRRELY